eukprot:CFRG5451T1
MNILKVLILLVGAVLATELTFELEDKKTFCVYERVRNGNNLLRLEYQVIYGGVLGKSDIDVTVISPSGIQLYEQKKTTIGEFVQEEPEIGEFKVCFGNEFSAISHKIVYFDLYIDQDDATMVRSNDDHHATVLNRMTTMFVNIRDSFNTIVDAQTHHRVNEMHGRNLGEEVHYRVGLWSAVVSACMITVSITQVWMVKRLFQEQGMSYRSIFPRPRYFT